MTRFLELITWKNKHGFGLLGAVFFMSVVGLWTDASVASDRESCLLAGAKSNVQSPLSYRNRGDRCEGMYVRPVSGGTVRVVGFHAGKFSQRSLADLDHLNIGTHGSQSASDVAIILNFTRFNTYYAMDTQLPGSSRLYSWPTTLIARAIDKPTASELGILACTENCQSDARALIPVALSSKPEEFSDYMILLKPDSTLSRIQYRLSRDGGGEPKVVTMARRFSGGVTYPVTLPDLEEGKWTIRITGVSLDGTVGMSTERLLISVPSKQR